MEFQLSTSAREPIYRQIVEQVREAVALGRVQPGEQLPSVRELSRTLVVNPNTIARAYTELERDGVLNNHQGKGVFVARPSSDLTRAAKKRRLVEQVDRLLTEAVHLGFTSRDVRECVTDRADRFQWGTD
ncbi:MAG: GntR family transcriptional regulator [Planctomycetaceae bacterium]|nr:GntR family transcriptional regulator [Planctomycetaceae bacterium]